MLSVSMFSLYRYFCRNHERYKYLLSQLRDFSAGRRCVSYLTQFASFRSAAPLYRLTKEQCSESLRIESNMTQFWSDVKFGFSLYFLNLYFVRCRRHFLFISVKCSEILLLHPISEKHPALRNILHSDWIAT